MGLPASPASVFILLSALAKTPVLMGQEERKHKGVRRKMQPTFLLGRLLYQRGWVGKYLGKAGANVLT